MPGTASTTLGRRALLGTAAFALLPALLHRPARAEAQPQIVATFSILADLVGKITGSHARVATLVGPNADTHSYQGRPRDAEVMARAPLLVSNGLGFEAWLPRLAAAGKFAGRQVVASDGIAPLFWPADSAHGVPDPHCWHDVGCARRYVANILTGLVEVDADNAGFYRDRAADFDARLASLDTWVRAEIARVPANKRRVITDHAAFGYFARAYGVEFLNARGIGVENAPAAREMATLIALVRTHKTRALFVENLTDPRLIEQVARDSGGFVGDTLYGDALSPANGPAANYEALMRHNVRALVAGMERN
ncbi:MAG TPA: zinc ABC transporter substrate-binding protein [Reyranella sp.]|nr:zinc ABC transporter substrate-binding protein [Reyranella sp.]